MKTEEGVSGAIELRGDTAAEERTAAGRIDGRVDGFAWHVDGFTRENEDIEIADFATEDAADRPEEEERGELLNSFGESDGFSGGVSLIGERGYIGVSVSTYNSDYGLPGPEEEGEEEEEEEGPPIADGPFIELEQTRFDLRGEYQFDGAIESVEFLFARNDYEHAEIEPSGEVATEFDNEAWEARIELNHAPIGEWRGTVGLQINNREFSAVGEEAFIAPTDTDSVGIFIYEQRQFDDVLIDFGARVDFLEHDQSQDLEDYDETAFSFAVGARWEFAPGYDFNVNLSRSERHPDAAELYSEGAHLATALAEVGLLATLEEDGIVIAGPGSADTEVSNNLDIAIHHHSETLSWKFGIFFNDISDYTFREAEDIFVGDALVLIDGLAPAPYQQVDAEFYGYEAELNWTPGGESSPWGVRVFSDMVRAEDDDSEDLPRIPPNRLGTAVSYQTSRWTANLSAIYHAETGRHQHL